LSREGEKSLYNKSDKSTKGVEFKQYVITPLDNLYQLPTSPLNGDRVIAGVSTCPALTDTFRRSSSKSPLGDYIEMRRNTQQPAIVLVRRGGSRSLGEVIYFTELFIRSFAASRQSAACEFISLWLTDGRNI